jgi:hypothetical protein
MMTEDRSLSHHLKHIEAATSRHLHIEKHKIRLRFSNDLNSLQPGLALDDSSNIRVTPQ